MLLDFDVQRCTRRCAATDRSLEPGEECFSVLESDGAEVVRKDFCSEAWTGAPESAIGWWKSRIPEPTAKKIKLAPSEVLLQLFDELADRPDQLDLRYVLTLLLIRRRVLRIELPAEQNGASVSTTRSGADLESVVVHCPKRDATYEVIVSMPHPTRIDEIQQRLSELLIAGAE